MDPKHVLTTGQTFLVLGLVFTGLGFFKDITGWWASGVAFAPWAPG